MEGERIKMKHFVPFFPPEPGTEMKSYLQTATENKQSCHFCAGRLEEKKIQEQYNNNKNNKIKGT